LWRILIQEECICGIAEPLNTGVLDVFGHGEQSRFNNQGPKAAAGLLLTKPNLFSDGGAKCSPTDHDDIEWPPTRSLPRIDLIEIVAEISALNVLCE